MFCQINEQESAALARLFYAEYEACQRIRNYAVHILDASFAARLEKLADGHEARFGTLLRALKCERGLGEEESNEKS